MDDFDLDRIKRDRRVMGVRIQQYENVHQISAHTLHHMLIDTCRREAELIAEIERLRAASNQEPECPAAHKPEGWSDLSKALPGHQSFRCHNPGDPPVVAGAIAADDPHGIHASGKVKIGEPATPEQREYVRRLMGRKPPETAPAVPWDDRTAPVPTTDVDALIAEIAARHADNGPRTYQDGPRTYHYCAAAHREVGGVVELCMPIDRIDAVSAQVARDYVLAQMLIGFPIAEGWEGHKVMVT